MSIWRKLHNPFAKPKRSTPDLRKSFILAHGGGEMWVANIDNLEDNTDLIVAKIREDHHQLISCHVMSHNVLYHLKDTHITEEIANIMMECFSDSAKQIKKLAFVGVDRHGRKILDKKLRECINFKIIYKYFFSIDEAKDWLVSEGMH